MKINLIDTPIPLRLGTLAFDERSLRHGILYSLPALLIAAALALTGFTALTRNQTVRDRALSALERAHGAQTAADSESDLRARAARIASLRAAFARADANYDARLADLIALGNALPANVRIKSTTISAGASTLSGESRTIGALEHAQDALDHRQIVFVVNGHAIDSYGLITYDATFAVTPK